MSGENLAKEKNILVQYIPSFVDTDDPPERYEFDTPGELMNTELVKRWSDPGYFFAIDGDGPIYLMRVREDNKEWHVVGYLKYPVDLPRWEYKGR